MEVNKTDMVPHGSLCNRQPQLNNQQSYVHGSVLLFDIALKGIESGYRQYFRSIPADLCQHHTLCETYEFLGVDILDGQSINEIFNDLKSGKTDYELEYKYYRAVKGQWERGDAAKRAASGACDYFSDRKDGVPYEDACQPAPSVSKVLMSAKSWY